MSGPRDRESTSPELYSALSAAAEQREDGTLALVLAGELDTSTSRALGPLAREIADQCGGDVEVDARALRFCDAAGLGALVALNNELREQGRCLRITSANARLARLLAITGLAHLLR